MEQELNNSKVHLEQNDIHELLNEVKETLAKDIDNKSFSTTDLWNIQRSKKTYLRRTTLWN